MIEDIHLKIDPYSEEIWNEEMPSNEDNSNLWSSGSWGNGLPCYGCGVIDNSNRITDYIQESLSGTTGNDVSCYKFEYKHQKNKQSITKVNKNIKKINTIRKICNYHK